MEKMQYWGKQFLKGIMNWLDALKVTLLEFHSIGIRNKSAKKAKLESQILVTVHSLEKGMGIKETRKGYGQAKARNIINYLKEYVDLGYSCDSYVYFEAIKMLEEYIYFQKVNGINLDYLHKQVVLLKEEINEEKKMNYSNYKCGVNYIKDIEFLRAKEIDFDLFVSLRHSIRDYTEEVVDKDTVRKAIKIANTAPSACNRQPIKVYCTSTYKQAQKVDDLVTGTRGFKGNTSNFMLITCDRAYFYGAEQYQWYVNGGIYISYLTLALHSLGIGSCIMQWYAFYKTEKELKKIFDINYSEAIVAVVGFGYYKKSNKCICAHRRDVDEVLTFL